jgi:hypothetical protein
MAAVIALTSDSSFEKHRFVRFRPAYDQLRPPDCVLVLAVDNHIRSNLAGKYILAKSS